MRKTMIQLRHFYPVQLEMFCFDKSHRSLQGIPHTAGQFMTPLSPCIVHGSRVFSERRNNTGGRVINALHQSAHCRALVARHGARTPQTCVITAKNRLFCAPRPPLIQRLFFQPVPTVQHQLRRGVVYLEKMGKLDWCEKIVPKVQK